MHLLRTIGPTPYHTPKPNLPTYTLFWFSHHRPAGSYHHCYRYAGQGSYESRKKTPPVISTTTTWSRKLWSRLHGATWVADYIAAVRVWHILHGVGCNVDILLKARCLVSKSRVFRPEDTFLPASSLTWHPSNDGCSSPILPRHPFITPAFSSFAVSQLLALTRVFILFAVSWD